MAAQGKRLPALPAARETLGEIRSGMEMGVGEGTPRDA